MPNDTVVKVQEYKDSLILKAEMLITKGFPENIVRLNELLATPIFNERNFEEVHQDLNIPVLPPLLVKNELEDPECPPNKRQRVDVIVSGQPVMGLPAGTVPCNKPLCEMIKVVKPIIRKLVEDSNLLKMWISFMIPKIEDGNNFGVSIQEDTLAEIQTVESEAAAFFDQISRYFLSRAKVVSKVAKYPHIDDYRRAVVELDEKEYLSLWLVVCEVRNRYSSLHDIVIKNLEKLKKPRSSNTESLY
ncbi:proteasome activator complex subunit 3 [Drosophila simulans]|uniref:GD17109 n=2 Tax=melanogaster subgroup TaxID=32351 RepID=B4R4A2_DROSI|nr:proteasome activator complex subunit 3 [Drosophila simulans]XP_016039163.1 proteasome activator complex subunit 3 [Drosophila simulans]XP_016039164.1 proteasome activator complex subunit 3 [Drosophila simulans]XP_033171881.1 proteasome activator complex subunit 3 [Drosophila mauritiana]XP_033171882.1 proteasome activator complex subunit 3 [Drosophila mauritiana]XP_039152580.1 proteasome activator complex subunit 3 [Drosophila simulans]EDX17804.1 GD17109 [Drosophila simulans]KMZ09562.1 unc